MKLRNIAGSYFASLRDRLGQELLALTGIAVGVSLLFAALVANSSLTGSFERLTDRVVGDARLQLSARGSTTLSENLLDEARQLPGVATAAATLEERGEVVGSAERRSILLIGVTPEFGGLGGSFARGFSYRFLANVRAMALPTPIVDGLGLALGQPVALNIGSTRVAARLGAKLQASDVGTLVNSPVAIAPLKYVQQLTGQPHQLSRLFVVPKPSRDKEVQAELKRLAAGRGDVRPADFDTALFRQASQPTSQSTAMFSVFGAMVGFLFAFSAMLLTVPQRRRLIDDLRIEGYGTGSALNVLLFDALVLGAIASALGVVVGNVVASHLFDETPSFLQYAFVVGPDRVVGLRNVVLAGAGGLIASCVAVVGPNATALFRQHQEGAPSHADGKSSARSRAFAVAGSGFLIGGALIAAAARESAAIGVAGLGCLTISMLLLLPSLLRLLVRALDVSTARVRNLVPFLAIHDLRDPTAQARSLAVAATGAVAVFGSVALSGAHADLLRGMDRTSQDVAGLGDVWAVASGDTNLLVTSPFPAPSIRPDHLPGIKRLATYRGGFLDIGDRRVRAFAPPVDGPSVLSDTQLLEGDKRTVQDRLRAGGWIVISRGIARDRGVHVGDAFRLPSPKPITLRVAAISTNMGWPPGAIVLSATDFARAWRSEKVSAVLATLTPGTSPAEGRAALRSALGPRSTLAVYTAAERERDQNAAARAGVARLEQIAHLVLLSAVIAMASAMGGLMWQRRIFVASLKVEGYGTRQIWHGLLVEAAILIGAGCAMGAVFGLFGQGLLSRTLTSVTGFPVVYSLAGGEAVLTCVLVTIAAVAIVGVFGRRVAGIEPDYGAGE